MSTPKNKISADFDRRVNKPSVVQRFITEDKADQNLNHNQNPNPNPEPPKIKEPDEIPKTEKISIKTDETEELKNKIDFLTAQLEKINQLETKINIIENAQDKLKNESVVLTNSQQPFVDTKTKYYLRNIMEEEVVSEVTASLKHISNICKCEKCFNDICAIALNATPPNYATSEQGELLGKANTLLNIETRNRVSREVFKAVEKVKKQPMH